jgi:hypothetical protein
VLDVGSEEVGGDADVVLVDRHVAPGDDPLALLGDGALQQGFELGPPLLVLGQEADADAVGPGRREVLAERCTHERVGHLQQDARAVARVRVAPPRRGARGSPARDRPLDRLVRGLTLSLATSATPQASCS